jgi:hypothetical protein
MKALIITHRSQIIPSPAGLQQPSINSSPGRLIGKHFIEKIPPAGKKAKPQ